MKKKTEKITLDQLKARIDEARSDHSLPPKVDQLLSMLWVTTQGLNDQLKEALEANQELVDERDRLKRELYGKKSEQAKPKSDPKKKKKKKKRKPRNPERETLSKTPLPEEVQEHKAPETCPKCGGDELRDLNAPKEHIEYKLRPATLIRVRHRLQKCVCTRGCTVVTATSPDRVGDSGTQFGPSVYAYIIASRTFDALPFSRLSDRWRRQGVPLHKSTISDLFHRGSEELQPLYDELLKVIYKDPLVYADERRDTLSRAIVGQLKTLIEESLKTAPPKSKIGKALIYMNNHWESLTRFLEDASLPLDNNHAERLLRRIAIARKTSLFIYSGTAYQIAYSLVHSCRLNGINPEMYLADVLIRIKSAKLDEVRDLLPDRWKPPDGELGGRWL